MSQAKSSGFEGSASGGHGACAPQDDAASTVPRVQGSVATVFVNGIFNPKDEASWASQRETLESIFDCPAVHVHNPTLAIDVSHEQAANLVRKNAGFAFGAALMATVAVAVDAYMETGITAKVIASTMDGIKSSLEPKAEAVAKTMEYEIGALCQTNENLKTINLVSHSHGGWCTECFIRNGHAASLAQMHGLTFNVYVMGCPVLVRPDETVSEMLQLHNSLDIISMRYESRTTFEGVDYVQTQARQAYHSCSKYINWLKTAVSDPNVI
mmetsp:Transcript_14188/g.27597  ORF Transcript_14188/g.27597 Transcript_14188/m.27597 type:complete len:269 (+) Transcript_14188:95-901(+)